MNGPRIPAELLREQVTAWHRIDFSEEHARLVEGDVNRFNDGALIVSEEMAFEAEPTTFAATLDLYAED